MMDVSKKPDTMSGFFLCFSTSLIDKLIAEGGRDTGKLS